MIHLIFYDIENDRIRKKVADKLQEEGLERIQYSVFVGPLSTVRKEVIATELAALLDKQSSPQDRIMILHILASDLEKMIILGDISVDLAYLAGTKNTLIL